jgi:hypothetical protein
MNPPSMEAIFLILSGVILMAGILYWLWSHIQLTQKKVLLIENSVHELRDILSKRVAIPEPLTTNSDVKNAAVPVYNDLSDDDWNEEEQDSDDANIKTVPMVSTPLDALDDGHDIVVTHMEANTFPESEVDDLQPGGRILSGDENGNENGNGEEKEFRELFAARTPEGSAISTGTTLESMSVKELRRIAEQRGVARVSEMRKRELLIALREQSAPVAGNLDSVFVERVVDISEIEAVPVLE